MGYLGTPIDTNNTFQSLAGKRFNGDGSATDFTLDVAPTSTFDIEVFVENVRQDPNSAYTLSGTTLAFAAAPGAGTNNIYVIHQAKAVGTISAGEGTVQASSFSNDVISGHDALAATPADTDEFLVSDAGTIKRIDFSHIKGVIRQVVSTTKTDTATISSSGFADVSGLTLDITPSSSASKVLIKCNITLNHNDANHTVVFRFVRESTAVGVGAAASDRLQASAATATVGGGDHPQTIYAEFLDSPSASGEITYKIQIANQDGAEVMVNRNNNADTDNANANFSRYASTITAMEVLA